MTNLQQPSESVNNKPAFANALPSYLKEYANLSRLLSDEKSLAELDASLSPELIRLLKNPSLLRTLSFLLSSSFELYDTVKNLQIFHVATGELHNGLDLLYQAEEIRAFFLDYYLCELKDNRHECTKIN